LNKVENFFTEYWNTLKFLTVVGTVILAFFALDQYLDDKIENKITDDTYIGELSRTLRPFLVFDNDGIIKYDHGALTFIDSIRVKHTTDRWADTINIYTKSLLQEAPLLQFIGAYLYSYEVTRTSNFCWTFDMRPSTYLGLAHPEKNKPILDDFFTLEILR
jgi:hypothetical protein